MTDLTIVDQGTGFEIHVDPVVVAEALHKAGWTVHPPVTAEEALALAMQPYRNHPLRGLRVTPEMLDDFAVPDALMTEAEASAALDQDRTGAHTGRPIVEGWQGHTQRSWRGADQSQTLVPEPVDHPGRHRTGDHATSVVGARDVAFRAGTQLHRLLSMYEIHAASGLTDEEAGGRADLLRSCYWKRCGELRQDGFIEVQRHPGGEPRTRAGSAGSARIVCSITDDGTAYLARLTPAM